MAAASYSDLIMMIPELSTRDSGIVNFYLAKSSRFVIIDGFSPEDENFDLLQIYFCGHLMVQNGIIRDKVTQESVSGSISVGFTDSTSKNYPDTWFRQYLRLKTELQQAGAIRVV